MRIGSFSNILKTLLLVKASIALSIGGIKVAHIGKVTPSRYGCKPFLKQREAMISPNKQYMLILDENGQLFYFNRKNGRTIWKSEIGEAYFARPPYNAIINSNGELAVIDRFGDNIWSSGFSMLSYYEGPYEVVLNDEGEFYVKDIVYSVPFINPDASDIDENSFKELCNNYENTKLSRYDDKRCIYWGNNHKEFIDYCVNTLNSTFTYDYVNDQCTKGKQPNLVEKREQTFKNEEPSILYTFYIKSNGEHEASNLSPRLFNYPSPFSGNTYCKPEYNYIEYEDGSSLRIITELNSKNNGVMRTDDTFYVKAEDTELKFYLDEDTFEFTYDLPYYERSVDIFRQSFFNRYHDPKISAGILDDDAVFRIYSTEGKLVYELGEPCSVRGFSTLTLEQTDAYLDNDYYKVHGKPLTHGLVITNAIGGKFYYPPRNTTTTTTKN